MEKPGLYLVYGALRRNEENPDQPLEMTCSFSAFASMCLRHAGVPHQTILADTHHKPQWYEKRWFKELPESKSATFPAIIRVSDDGTSEFVGDSAAVVDAACRWYPDAAEKLASAAGGHPPAEALLPFDELYAEVGFPELYAWEERWADEADGS